MHIQVCEKKLIYTCQQNYFTGRMFYPVVIFLLVLVVFTLLVFSFVLHYDISPVTHDLRCT